MPDYDFDDLAYVPEGDGSDLPLSSQILPALGLDALEQDRFGFHVVGGYNVGENLAEAFGEEQTLLIDADRFNPDHFTHQVDVLSKRGNVPIRVIIQNLSEVRPEGVYELEKLFQRENGYPIKSVWFIDDGQDVERNLRHKVLMQCDQTSTRRPRRGSLQWGGQTRRLQKVWR
jgi:hypothetical protein